MKTLKQSLFMVACLGGVASGNAFNINEHDARVTGRGGASAASNTDASSVIFNPGGIPIAEGTQVSIAGSVYFASGSYEDAAGETETDSDPSIVPAIYLTSRVHDMIAVGIGFHLPFGLAVSWPDNHRQADVIQDQTLRTYFITPSIGLNLHKQVPGLSIGGGVDIVPATIKLERAVRFGDVEGTATLGGDAVGIGGRVGVMYHPPAAKGLKLGVMYRSKIDLDFEGTGDFDIADPFRAALPPDGDITAGISLPQSVWGGVAYSPIPQLELELNTVWINWADTWEDDALTIGLADGTETSSPQEYKNTLTWRIGAEYAVNEKAAVRAGFIYDPTPISSRTQTAQLPDIDRKNVALGGSYKFGTLAAHLGFLWVTPGTRETSDTPYQPFFKGTYGVQAFVASLMISGSFGGSGSPASTAPVADPTVASR